jgi:hypothetical protein
MSQIYWRTHSKKLIKISEMTVEHLTNTIRMIDDMTDNQDPDSISHPWAEEREAMELELEHRKQIYDGITPAPDTKEK